MQLRKVIQEFLLRSDVSWMERVAPTGARVISDARDLTRTFR